MKKYKGKVARDLVQAARIREIVSGQIIDRRLPKSNCPFTVTYTCRLSALTENKSNGPSQ